MANMSASIFIDLYTHSTLHICSWTKDWLSLFVSFTTNKMCYPKINHVLFLLHHLDTLINRYILAKIMLSSSFTNNIFLLSLKDKRRVFVCYMCRAVSCYSKIFITLHIFINEFKFLYSKVWNPFQYVMKNQEIHSVLNNRFILNIW